MKCCVCREEFDMANDTIVEVVRMKKFRHYKCAGRAMRPERGQAHRRGLSSPVCVPPGTPSGGSRHASIDLAVRKKEGVPQEAARENRGCGVLQETETTSSFPRTEAKGGPAKAGVVRANAGTGTEVPAEVQHSCPCPCLRRDGGICPGRGAVAEVRGSHKVSVMAVPRNKVPVRKTAKHKRGAV